MSPVIVRSPCILVVSERIIGNCAVVEVASRVMVLPFIDTSFITFTMKAPELSVWNTKLSFLIVWVAVIFAVGGRLGIIAGIILLLTSFTINSFCSELFSSLVTCS
ncbi:hypothetical protein HRbin34_00603 [bacterium HR34]|nr:hypothetical protein HRbin34_00603 [bacterium HR34]